MPHSPAHRRRRRLRPLPLVAAGVLVAAAAVALPQLTPDASAATTLRGYADGRGVKIGAAVGDTPLTSDSAYTSVLDREFNSVTAENAMKWDAVEPTRGSFNWAAADRLVAHASAHNQGVRGHTLAWYAQLPSWLKNGNFSASELNSILKSHIDTEVGRYKGKVYAWDVVNEAFNDDGSMRGSLWQDKLGTGYIANALKWAHAADPAAKLYINDYSIEADNAKSDALYALAKQLLADGVPLNGIGFQSHFVVGQVPSTMKANLKRFSDLGLEVSVTELDIRIPLPASSAELAQQSADYKTASENCLGVPRCAGVTVWGVSDKYSWIPGTFSGYGAALPYDENYAAKPAYTGLSNGVNPNA
ncbi:MULTISPECIES: endo-1,4-beta-xylanase [unclassified Streptomyces]|uniref:endo-1,4-beta-xylanase n=1 Tax=unclassified Streptomyces TaxID=2593676 RepID=UPI002E80D7A6|nr:endo-1,4-beta-xylanase [Streptomyces sp. NBC_00589]WTI35347.1 endo-1,4-beta-xylanase [Streptomyces sp. NBC_00775]WUB30979.1 endo-1,4-beta-xylanase [Streptomyces sp. NBC_00589]